MSSKDPSVFGLSLPASLAGYGESSVSAQNEVLRLFARTLRYHAPPGVLVARMGGEEFALLGDETQLPEVEVILASVRAVRLPFDLRMTTSIGICQGPLTDDNDWKRLYRLADKALFQAKAAGRDRAGRALAA